MAPPNTTPAPAEQPSGVQQVDPVPSESIGARFLRQNKVIERALKDPVNDEVRQKHEIPPARHLPVKPYSGDASPAYYPGIEDGGHYIARRLEGETLKLEGEPEARSLAPVDLYRAYKHTPHQPASVFLKYLVHRINNAEKYDDPIEGAKMDVAFLAHHQVGGASNKNGHLLPGDMHLWMKKHPGMVESLLEHQAALHRHIQRGIGLNVKDINGQPYVALTRGLQTDIMNHEHALSSWADLPDTGFGKFMHHAWVPLKDLWYSYDLGSSSAAGEHGPEDEYLVSHSAPRYAAEPHDVKSSRLKSQFEELRRPLAHLYDSSTDEAIAADIGAEHNDGIIMALSHKNAGPLAFAEVQRRLGPQSTAFLATKFVPREEAIRAVQAGSVWASRNPNLTTEDLSQVAPMLSVQGMYSALDDLVKHPRATADTVRAAWSQRKPGSAPINLVGSPLAPTDVLDEATKQYVDWRSSADYQHANKRDILGAAILRNPNHTSNQADAIARSDIAMGRIEADLFSTGRYSAGLVKELSDVVEAKYGQEPLPSNYIHGIADRQYNADLDKFNAAKKNWREAYAGIARLATNRMLDDEATEAVIDVAERRKVGEALRSFAHRQNYTPMSETVQLRLMRALTDTFKPVHGTAEDTSRVVLASAKGLAPTAVWALALHPDAHVRDALYHNATVDPEVLAKAWPDNLPSPQEYADRVYNETPGLTMSTEAGGDPMYHLARAIVDRRAYAARKATEHLILPWPQDLAKAETEWWTHRLREWMSARVKGDPLSGYYYRAPNLDLARATIKDRLIPVEPTDEVLDGFVVLAHPAKDYHYHAWEDNPEAGPVLVYFETDSPPTPLDDRVYWPHNVAVTDARIAGIRSSNLQKDERPIGRASAFNGEKDYNPDHADDAGGARFPFLGGAHKEETEETAYLNLPGSDLEPGEHATALAQLGHSDRYELALAAACFLGRKRYDPEKFQQGLAIYADEARAALHAVDLADSEKNLRALAAVVQLQRGKASALSKAEEPQPIGIHSIQPGNEDAVETAESVERAVRSSNVMPLKLNGKHSKGAMAARDPRTGKVFLLKPGSGKQSPAAGARDGSVSQSRREACFWHVADKVHLGGAIPHVELLIVNAQEWAAISLLGSDWKSLDERNREKQYKGRQVLTPYLANGQLHRWAILDFVLGNTDSHGQNLLVNDGGSVALIDHGAAFAGPKFDPAHDTKSFIPFYLRVWAPDSDFKKLPPDQRFKHMPVLPRHEDEVLRRWLVEDFTSHMLEREARKYGIDDLVIKACQARLSELQSAKGNLSATVNALWSGAPVPKGDLLG